MDLDLTLIFQLTIFVSVLAILNRLLLSPFLKIIEARHDKIFGLRELAERLEKQSFEEKSAYQNRLLEARIAAQKTRETWIKKGRDEERRLISTARGEVTEVLAKVRTQLSQEAAQARRELEPQTAAISKMLVEKVLGRALTS
jgi:F-type H+-transporting ATPase subunit b